MGDTQTAETRINRVRCILKFKGEYATVCISPNQAKQLLLFNTNNRRISEHTVTNYAKQMAKDEWHDSNDAITFDKNGILSNGQHRLRAIMKSGKTIKLHVMLNIDNFAEMDRGKSRTIADNISTSSRFAGTEIASNKVIQQVATVLVRIIKNKSNVSTEDVIRFLDIYGDDMIYLDKLGIFTGPVGLKDKAISAALLVCYKNNVELSLIQHVREILNSGMATSEKDAPIIALRDKLITLMGGGMAVSRTKYKYTMYCVHALERGVYRKMCTAQEPKYTINID